MKVNLILDLPECPYWNYEDHTRTHDCHSCHCASEGNNAYNVRCGVMVGKDRYCTLDYNIESEILKEVEKLNNETNSR